MYLTKFSLTALAVLSAAQCLLAAPSTTTGPTNKCKNFTTDFSQGLGEEWTESKGTASGWNITSQGLEMSLDPPNDLTRLKDSDGKLKF
jgi:hypothetical protein